MTPRPCSVMGASQPRQQGGSVVEQHGGRLELIEGTWHAKGYPPVSHSRVAAALVQAYLSLHQGARPGEGWWIVTEPDIILGENRVIPSLAGWRKQRIKEPPSGTRWRVAPDWICELSSAATRNLLYEVKRELYRRQRVPFLWEVDVGARCIDVWQLTADPASHELAMRVMADEEAVGLAPFQALRIVPASLWK